MVVWSTDRPRSLTSSWTSRYDREYRKYHRTAHTMITGSKCRHLNRAGRGLHTALAYQNLLDSRFATHPLREQGIVKLERQIWPLLLKLLIWRNYYRCGP